MKTILPLCVVSAALLSACGAVGPDYRQPSANVPPGWSEPVPGAQAPAAGDAKISQWWSTFHDPALDQLVARALHSNLDLRLAGERVREARARAGYAEADLLPTAQANASAARVRASHHQPVLGSLPVPKGTPFQDDVSQVGFDASWEIDVFGGKRREDEAANADLQAAQARQRGAVVTLLGEVARSYLDLRADQRRKAIAQDNITAQEQALAITRDRAAHGLSSQLDVEQAATVLANTRAAVPGLDRDADIATHRLAILLGQPPGALAGELAPAQDLPAAPPLVPVGLPSDLIRRRPDVQAAERALAAATARIGVARADLFPHFYLTGGAGYESIDSSPLFSPSSSMWSIGPSVSWHIFDYGHVRANIRLQEAAADAARTTYDATILTALGDVEDALVSYAQEQNHHRELTAAVASSAHAVELARQLYANGIRDFTAVLDAERSLYTAQDQSAQSDQAIDVDVVALYKALGGGWEDVGAKISMAH
jgi:NodT family efflux transporter outer membrane factor (OMF) lipoprotein